MSKFMFFAVFIPLTTTALYWIHGTLYFFLADKPKLCKKYKLQKKDANVIQLSTLIRVCGTVKYTIVFTCYEILEGDFKSDYYICARELFDWPLSSCKYGDTDTSKVVYSSHALRRHRRGNY